MLKYVGDGMWLPDVPARDLNDAEVARYGGERYLVATGLYKSVRVEEKSKRKEEVKDED